MKKYRLNDVFNCYIILEKAINEYVVEKYSKGWSVDDFDFNTDKPENFVCLVNISKYLGRGDTDRKLISINREELRKLINV
jgi:hypothetical protein